MKATHDKVESQPSEIFILHAAIFCKFRRRFGYLYRHYPNKDKIIDLLDYWLFSIYAIKKIYGDHGLTEFLDSELSNPQRFSFWYEFENLAIGRTILQKKPSRILFFILSLFCKRLLLPGADLGGIYEKFQSKISNWYMKSICPVEHESLKGELFKYLDEIFFDCLSFSEIARVKEKLPKVFYSRVIDVPRNGEIFIEGSCASFLEFSGLENIMLFSRVLKITGVQHGGGYDVFKVDHFADYEKKLADEFIGWGFSARNRRQRKFKKRNLRGNLDSNIRRILWIEDSLVPSLYFASMPYHHYQSLNLATKEYIFNELRLKDFPYSSLYHPAAKSDLYEVYRRDDYILAGKGPSESLVCSDDILLFDNVGSTLIHFALEHNVTFFQVIDRSDFDRFSVSQRHFFGALRNYGFAFYNDEIGSLSEALMLLRSRNELRFPDELVRFNESFFHIEKDDYSRG